MTACALLEAETNRAAHDLNPSAQLKRIVGGNAIAWEREKSLEWHRSEVESLSPI